GVAEFSHLQKTWAGKIRCRRGHWYCAASYMLSARGHCASRLKQGCNPGRTDGPYSARKRMSAVGGRWQNQLGDCKDSWHLGTHYHIPCPECRPQAWGLKPPAGYRACLVFGADFALFDYIHNKPGKMVFPSRSMPKLLIYQQKSGACI